MATRTKEPKCNGKTSQSCGMGCIPREHTCRELIAADVATRLLSVAKQHQQPNDAAGQSFDSVAANFSASVLKAAHKTGVATKDFGNGATLTTKVATGLDGSSIKYGFVTDADGKRYTVSDGLVKEVTSAAGSEWGEAFDAAVRSKVAKVETVVSVSQPKLPRGITKRVTRADGEDQDQYEFKIGGNDIAMIFSLSPEGDRYVDFKVNNGYLQTGSLTPVESARTAVVLAKTIAYDVSEQPDGTTYATNAFTGDGQGAKRTLAFMRIGFSRPVSGVLGEDQYGLVKDGKLTPDLDKAVYKDFYPESVIKENVDKLPGLRETAKLNRQAKGNQL